MQGDVVTAIAAMAEATAATRLAGLVVPRALAGKGRIKAAFDALPAAVLAAIVAPVLLASGWAEMLAGLAVVVAARYLPLIPLIILGVLAAAGARAVLG
ncbi:MAG: AzlD domain-containing protein [Rhodospirillaceae bacterium]|nr:AzlD domain-containing protein [Rhodospirillaceae bacterium]